MRITTDLLIVLCVLMRLVSAKHAIKFSKKKTNISSILRRSGSVPLFMSYDRSAYPEPLPPEPPKKIELTSYRTLYQGARYGKDKRVFRKRFDYEAMLTGQQIVYQGLFDCLISHIAIESTEAIPVLLRGGVGYRHFMAVVKSKPNHELKGQVRVYCKKNPSDSSDEDRKKKSKPRRFDFGARLAEENLT